MTESAETPRMTCDAFQSTLGDFLEGGLAEREQRLAEQHVASCEECNAIVSDLDHIVHAAGALPTLAPARDLWPEIESRLDASVVALPTRQSPLLQSPTLHSTSLHSRNVSWRALAAAAALLITASAGVTWTLARNTAATVEVPALATNIDSAGGSAAPSEQVAASNATTGTSVNSTDDSLSPALDGPATDQIRLPDDRSVASNNTAADTRGSTARASVPASTPVTPTVATANAMQSTNTAPQLVMVANPARMMALDTLYGREIAKLRTIAESQLGLLDSSTVNVVRRNLDIIDKAILESRAALESDPNSGFLLEQLDRAYERKVDLLRRLALL